MLPPVIRVCASESAAVATIVTRVVPLATAMTAPFATVEPLTVKTLRLVLLESGVT